MAPSVFSVLKFPHTLAYSFRRQNLTPAFNALIPLDCKEMTMLSHKHKGTDALQNPPMNSGLSVRHAIRSGEWAGHTSGMAPHFVQANMVFIPKDLAHDFLLYCQRNPKPCPLLAVSEPGDPRLPSLGDDLDVRTDLPRYQVWCRGERVAEPTDILALWRDGLVSFALGCSFSFEQLLIDAGIPLRHVQEGKNVAMYRTHIPTVRADFPERTFPSPGKIGLTADYRHPY